MCRGDTASRRPFLPDAVEAADEGFVFSDGAQSQEDEDEGSEGQNEGPVEREFCLEVAGRCLAEIKNHDGETGMQSQIEGAESDLQQAFLIKKYGDKGEGDRQCKQDA